LNGVEGLPNDGRDCRRPLPIWGGKVFDEYGCFLQGVSGMKVAFPPREFGDSRSGSRFILDTSPVDMKADCSGIADL